MIVVEYKKEFSHLIKYAPELVLIETFRCGQFEDCLKESIKRYLTIVTSLQVVNFYQLVLAAMKIEKSEIVSQERNRERKFSRGSSSSGKRTRDSQIESVHGSTTIGRSSDRGTPTGQEEIIECPHYHKHHFGICKRITKDCFRCGSTDHLIVNYPRGFGTSRNP